MAQYKTWKDLLAARKRIKKLMKPNDDYAAHMKHVIAKTILEAEFIRHQRKGVAAYLFNTMEGRKSFVEFMWGRSSGSPDRVIPNSTKKRQWALDSFAAACVEWCEMAGN